MDILLSVRNLMFAEKIQAAARVAGHRIEVFDPARAPFEPPDLLIVDLGEPGWEEAVAWANSRKPRPRVLGFGPHVRSDLFEAARKEGVDRCVANSRLAQDPAGLIAEMAGKSPS